ncbi:uncharacterized protein LOC142236760 [Haematobia irritans]|uniref:uncharacterized protein LOC142236760 n=1 Tax=Haematobia irritans TaxID=7368 RepID=UPI003F509291
MLSGDELDALTEVRDILKPLWNITKEISSEKTVTLSKCIPLVVALKMEVVPADPDDIWHYIDSSVCKEKQFFEEHDNALPLQLRQFLNTPTVNRKANPNPFIAWEVIQNEYPYVWKIAKNILPIVATSVPSERLFSHAGIIANQLRNRISPQHLNQLVFLRSLRLYTTSLQ